MPAAGQDVDDPAGGLGHNRNFQRIWFAGAVSGFGDVVFAPMVFREVPRDLLGRVLGLLNPVQQIASAVAIGRRAPPGAWPHRQNRAAERGQRSWSAR